MDALLETLRQNWPLIVGVIGLPALILGARKAYRELRASRLNRPVAFELPPVYDASAMYAETLPDLDVQMVGRDGDVGDFVKLVNEQTLVFLRGASGAGKSTFLKLGLGRALYRSGQWLPIYVDSWRSDWQNGPWQTLFDAVSLALRHLPDSERKQIEAAGPLFEDSQKLFDILRQIRPATGRRPVILFDQIDTYIDRFESNLTVPETNRSLDPDELSQRNQFWDRVRDLCRSADPGHCVIAARSDSSRVECFQLTRFHSRRLLNLPESAAFELIQTLGKDAVVNPENGFEDLGQRLTERLAQSGQGVLAIELRVVLAGLAKPHQRLTVRQLEAAGGVGGLAAQWLGSQIQQAQLDQREVLTLLLQLVDRAQRQTIPKNARELKYSRGLRECLKALEERRVLRVRYEGTDDEEWQLYHSYLAGAVLVLEERVAKWRLYLERAHEEYREAPWNQKWTRLIPPGNQLVLLWKRLRGQIQYGEHRAFAEVSAARLLVNTITVAAVLAFLGWSWWSSNTTTDALLNGFDDDDSRPEALWKLTSANASVKAAFLEKAFSRPATIQKLNDGISSVLVSLGLRPDSRSTAQRLVLSGPACRNPTAARVCASLAAYVERPAVTQFAAQKILDQMKEEETRDRTNSRTKDQVSELEQALALLAPEVRGDLAKQGAEHFLDRLKDELSLYVASELGNALALLSKEAKGDFATQGAQRIWDRLGNQGDYYQGLALGRTLAALITQVKGDDAARLAAQISDRLKSEKGNALAIELGPALFVLSKGVKGDFASQTAIEIYDRFMHEQDSYTAALLGEMVAGFSGQYHGDYSSDPVQRMLSRLKEERRNDVAGEIARSLASLASHVKGDVGASGAQIVLDRMKEEKDNTAAFQLSYALAPLAEEAKGNYAALGAEQILERLRATKDAYTAQQFGPALAALTKTSPDGLATQGAKLVLDSLKNESNDLTVAEVGDALASLAGREQIPVLVDLLKWPQVDRNQAIQRILELEGADPSQFGSFDSSRNYTAHLWQFVDWAHKQKDAQGRPLDLDSPPIGPQHLAERFGYLYPK